MNVRAKTVAALTMGMAVFVATMAVNADVVINDPLAYWSFEDVDNALSNQVISSSYHDATVIKGAPTFGLIEDAQGIVGNAMVLDGASGIRLPYHQDNLGTSFTISLWYWQQTNNTRQCVYQSRDNYTASYEAGGGNSKFANHVNQQYVGVITTDLKEWVHLVHTLSTVGNTTTFSVYANGVLRLTKSIAADNMFNVLRVRGLHVGICRDVTLDNGRCFKGMIDEVALWDRSLSVEEVLAVYQCGVDGQDLEFTARAEPAITLANGQLSHVVQTDAGILDGLSYNGWLRDNGAGFPGNVPDSARLAPEAIGSIMPDTAGHDEGPFNATKLADMRWRIPLTTGSALKQLPRGDFTVEAWFRTTSWAANVLFGTYPGTGGGVVNLQLEVNGQAMLYWSVGKLVERIQVTPPFDLKSRDGNWHHLAGVMDGTTAYLYMDGVQIGTKNVTTGPFDLGGDYLYIGQDGRGTFGLFNGEIGDARVWTRALSTNEVASIAAFGIPGVNDVARDGLLAAYAPYNPFNAASDQTGWRVALTPPLRQIPQTNYTYEVMFRTSDAGRGILMGNYNGVLTSVINFELEADNKFRLVEANGAGTWINCLAPEGSSGIRDGAWHRAAAVRRDGKVYLYMDGEQRGTATSDTLGSYALQGEYLGIGKDLRSSGAVPLNGDIASARIWSRALSVDELAGLVASNAVPTDGLVVQYAPFPTNTLHTAGFPGTSFLRSLSAGTNTAALVFTGLPNHTKIGLGLLLAQLDLLDPSGKGDHFTIKVDGAEVLSVGLGPDQGDKPQVHALSLLGSAADVQLFKDTLTFDGQDLFGCGNDVVYNDHVYDLSQLEALQGVPHTSDTLRIELLGIQNSVGENGGFGIDDIRLTLYPPQGTLIIIY